MTFKEQTEKGRWLEIKAELQNNWKKLTDSDLDKTKGDVKAITSLVQKNYGKMPEDYSAQVASIVKSHHV